MTVPGNFPKDWQALPLSAVAQVVFSNVDKVTHPGEIPVRLCNYTDVYKNDYILAGMEFMRATATREEIGRFGIQPGDVIITKDSETPNDIGISTVVDSSAADLVFGYHLALIRPNQELVDPTFLSKQLKHVRVARYFGGQVDTCVALLEDLPIRAEFINKLRLFYETLNIVEHRPEVPGDIFHDAKLLGFINKVAANLYRDPALNLLGVAEKVKALIDTHISARGVDPKIPLTAITDADFEKVLKAQTSSRARAAEMQHAARYHIIGFSNQNPAFARKMSEKLEEILKRFKDDWDALERELKKYVDELRLGDRADFPGFDPKIQVPFLRLMLEFCAGGAEMSADRRKQAIAATLDMVSRMQQEIAKVGFWKNSDRRELLTKLLVRDLNSSGVCPAGKERELAQLLVALAKENHEHLTKT